MVNNSDNTGYHEIKSETERLASFSLALAV